MFCGLRKGLRDTTIVILYHGCFDNVLLFEISYYCSLPDYVINMSHYNLYELLSAWLVTMLAENLGDV